MSHKSTIEAIRQYCELMGGVCNVLHQSGRVRGSAGVPDLYLQFPRLRRPCAFWMEVKVGRDALREAQAAFALREDRCGGEVLTGDLDALIERVGRAKEGLRPARNGQGCWFCDMTAHWEFIEIGIGVCDGCLARGASVERFRAECKAIQRKVESEGG